VNNRHTVEGAQATHRVGVLGGTFDPIHIGHLLIAEEARSRLCLDRVVFVPARISPLKQDDGTLFSDEERYAMIRAAIADNAAFAISRVDLDRPAPSFTVDTLRLLRQEMGEQHSYFFIMGADSLDTLSRWRRPEEIIRQARLVVVSRPGFRPDLTYLEARIPGISAATDVLEGLMMDVSSTEIRRRLATGYSIRYQVPEPVRALVEARGTGSASN